MLRRGVKGVFACTLRIGVTRLGGSIFGKSYSRKCA